jgi:hypothetical protein
MRAPAKAHRYRFNVLGKPFIDEEIELNARHRCFQSYSSGAIFREIA